MTTFCNYFTKKLRNLQSLFFNIKINLYYFNFDYQFYKKWSKFAYKFLNISLIIKFLNKALIFKF